MPDRRRLVGILAATPLRLRRLVRGFGPELATRGPRPGEWSAAEVLLHLVEGERDTFVPRLRRIVAEQRPVFAAGRPTRAADATLDLDVLVAVFAQARGEAVTILEGLTHDGWQREGVSPSRGVLSVQRYAAGMVDHDREHLRQLNEVRAAHGLPALRCEAGDPLPFEEILARMGDTPDRIGATIADLDAELLRRRPEPGEWSMQEVMAHLLTVEERLFFPRLERMRREEWPRFASLDPDVWVTERDWRLGDFGAEFADFRRARDRTLALLRGFGPAELERIGVTSGLGAVTIHEYATHVTEHDTEHLGQLYATRRRLPSA